jgi:hypothetical protein
VRPLDVNVAWPRMFRSRRLWIDTPTLPEREGQGTYDAHRLRSQVAARWLARVRFTRARMRNIRSRREALVDWHLSLSAVDLSSFAVCLALGYW